MLNARGVGRNCKDFNTTNLFILHMENNYKTMGIGGKANIQQRDSLQLQLANYYTAITYIIFMMNTHN